MRRQQASARDPIVSRRGTGDSAILTDMEDFNIPAVEAAISRLRKIQAEVFGAGGHGFPMNPKLIGGSPILDSRQCLITLVICARCRCPLIIGFNAGRVRSLRYADSSRNSLDRGIVRLLVTLGKSSVRSEIGSRHAGLHDRFRHSNSDGP